jgi:hypothetical protein
MSNKITNQAVFNANWTVDKAVGNAAPWEVRNVAWRTLFRTLGETGQVISVPVGSALQTARRDDLKHPALRAFLREASTRRKAR